MRPGERIAIAARAERYAAWLAEQPPPDGEGHGAPVHPAIRAYVAMLERRIRHAWECAMTCDNCGDTRTARCIRCDARACHDCDRCLRCRAVVCLACSGANVRPHDCVRV